MFADERVVEVERAVLIGAGDLFPFDGDFFEEFAVAKELELDDGIVRLVSDLDRIRSDRTYADFGKIGGNGDMRRGSTRAFADLVLVVGNDRALGFGEVGGTGFGFYP